MLYRPPAEQRLPAIQTMLESWNAEADRFRTAAMLARREKVQPSSAVVGAAEEVQGELVVLLDDIDTAIDRLAPGAPEFSALLHLRGTAGALLESVETSLDMLDRFVVVLAPEPMRIPRTTPTLAVVRE